MGCGGSEARPLGPATRVPGKRVEIRFLIDYLPEIVNLPSACRVNPIFGALCLVRVLTRREVCDTVLISSQNFNQLDFLVFRIAL